MTPQEFVDTIGDTSDEIAERIRGMGVVGVPKGGLRDHIINKAMWVMGISSWGYSVDKTGRMYINDCQIISNLKTPEPVKEFNRRFDAGEYTDLLDFGSWEVQQMLKKGQLKSVDPSVVNKLRVMRDG